MSEMMQKSRNSLDDERQRSKGSIDDDRKKGGVTLEDKKRNAVSVGSLKGPSKSTAAFNAKSMSRMKVRRPSFGFSGISGIRNVERTSQLGVEYKRPILAYLNTYQLEPSVRFNTIQVAKAIEEFILEYFTDYKYEKENAAELATIVAGQLMRVVKSMNFNRYRVITVVTIAQKRAQSYSNVIAFIWDHERDNYVHVAKELHSALIQITVFGIYLD